jgi:predicted N-acetyltransferase YhbS
VLPSLIEGRVFLASAAAAPQETQETQETLGCIIWNHSVTDDGAETLYFGPLAVLPGAQGRGVGSFLVLAVEALASTLRSSSAPKVRSVR